MGAFTATAGIAGLWIVLSDTSSEPLPLPSSATSIALKSANDQLPTPPDNSLPARSPNSEVSQGSEAVSNAPIKVSTPAPTVHPEQNVDTSATDDGIVILHIGDSHTSADFFTGELRRRLQERYGQRGVGYTTAGKPHIGVRSSSLKITTSSGWSYRSIQKRDAQPEKFWLSGYDAIATSPGETMTFASERPIPFDRVEIEAVSQPGGAAIDIAIDGQVEKHLDLEASQTLPVHLDIPAPRPGAELREVSITTAGEGAALIASMSIRKGGRGLTYNSVGYVGATVDVLNKIPEDMLASDLRRIKPQIVVLSFGTNEAANDDLDLAIYSNSYEQVVKKIKSDLPDAVIVMILPPDFNLLTTGCAKDKVATATCTSESRSFTASNASQVPTDKHQCVWRTPAKLAEVRKAQLKIAEQYGLAYWDWASIMPDECGAHAWYTASPPLMSRDHVHFTALGYKQSAERFLGDTLAPIVEKVRAKTALVATK